MLATPVRVYTKLTSVKRSAAERAIENMIVLLDPFSMHAETTVDRKAITTIDPGLARHECK